METGVPGTCTIVAMPTRPRISALCLLLAAACGGEGDDGLPVTTDAAAEQGAFGGVDAVLRCEETVRDFGTVWEGAVLDHEFRLEVRGTEAVTIKTMRADCGCAAGGLEVLGPGGVRQPYTHDTLLPPGTRLAVHLVYDTRGKRGPVPGSVQLYGDQKGGVTELAIKAEIRPWLVADPDDLQVPTMTVEESREIRLRVRSAVGEPFRLEHVRRAVPDTLFVDLEPLSPDEEGRSPSWEVAVRLEPGMPKGVHAYPIHLASDVENPDASPDAEGRRAPYSTVPRLAVEVVGRFRIVPASLDFGLVRSGETTARVLRIVCLDEDFDPTEPGVVLEPLKRELPFPLARTAHLSVRPVVGQRAWDVQLLLDGLAPEVERLFLARLVIETGHPAEPELTVAVRGTHHRSVARPPRGD